ncbi:MAG TPA: tRNA pseudouridine(38-40) synthase TruA [Geothermobacteraceae bacterium]|nr:tRNA pseudouridine(38-40) synthase TruA [Geothermobacteraceae bacterium]
MDRIKLIIEFDGAAFCGWQVQDGVRTVQQEIELALARQLGSPVRLHSSGRTDSGVHARGMVAHFDSCRNLPLKAYREGLNRLLPPDVAILFAERVSDDFHARYSATGKWYRYLIWNSPVRSPLQDQRVWHLKGPLNLELMQQASKSLVGRHDFAAFRAAGCEAKTTVREIYRLEVTREQQLLLIDVYGSGFLQNMVRIIAGTLVEVGQGKRSPDSLADLLAGGDRDAAGVTAPGAGLCLMEVFYS